MTEYYLKFKPFKVKTFDLQGQGQEQGGRGGDGQGGGQE